MIIGRGDIASAIKDDHRYLFFASGVSDSSCDDGNKFERERDYLGKMNPKSHIFYFSTLSIFYDKTPYTEHKEFMETQIKIHFERYTIIRIGNITWGNNKNIMVTYFRECLKKQIEPEIKDVYRHIVTLDDFQYWLEQLKNKPQKEALITGCKLKVSAIWEMVKNGLL